MQVKMDLARRIVTDFHSAAEARQAEEDFNREVREGAEPTDIGEVSMMGEKRLATALVTATLASSRTEAERLIKSGAVDLDGERCTDPAFLVRPGAYTVRAGKKWMRFIVTA